MTGTAIVVSKGGVIVHLATDGPELALHDVQNTTDTRWELIGDHLHKRSN